MLNLQTVIVPILDIDARLYGDRPIGARGKLERRIVAGLIAHLTEAGWLPSGLFDGDTTETVTDAKSTMELLFNLDDAHVYFTKDARSHWVRFVLGNGRDIICDHSYSRTDPTFGDLMDAFDPEIFE